ncbi:MAG TPA: hypothetical protein VFH24_04780 [Gemmatimonadales bacterium]|nr:hypothetical protein [Gemmatimonadales bacterium]
MSRKSRSQRRSRESPAVEGAAPAAGAGRRPRAVTALSRELADFLVEFSIVLHKRSMYPAGHPHLQDSADRFVRRMNLLLQTRDSVTLGVARHRLVIDSVTTDANNALVRDLAHRLHRHRIAAVHLSRGATLDEIESMLVALSADPQRGDGPLGKRLERVGPWTHIRLRPVGYDHFELQTPGRGTSPGPDQSEASAPRDSWVELAQLALASEDAGGSETDPLVVADAIGRKSGEVAYDRVVLGYLARVADEISRGKAGASDQLAQRISKLIGALNPETLQRLLAASTDGAEQRQFLLNASQILAADAVMEVVEAAAEASHQTISHNLLRLLHKLAHHAEDGPTYIRAEADGALRTNIARLIEAWELEDPNPSEYNAILEGMVRRSSGKFSLVNLQVGYDPEVIVKMALELDCVGPPVFAAVEELLSRRECVRVANLLEAIPKSSATDALWSYIATPERLERELATSPVDHEALSILVDRIGTQAADSLLDRLASASDRSTRAAVLKQLLALGPAVGQVAVARMPTAPWFVQRNILVLLGKLGSWPAGFSPAEYAINPDARIRREAIKLMLESPIYRGEGMAVGLADRDEAIVALALAAAVDACPPEAVAVVQRIAADPKRPSESRVLAVRILARNRTDESRQVLHELVLNRRRWLGRRLAPKSPELLAALTALATRWPDDSAVADVLQRASQHSDPDIRAAVRQPAT